MKKIYWATFLMIFSNLHGYSQIAFHDAQIIKENFITVTESAFEFKKDEASVQELTSYLRNYLPDSVKND